MASKIDLLTKMGKGTLADSGVKSLNDAKESKSVLTKIRDIVKTKIPHYGKKYNYLILLFLLVISFAQSDIKSKERIVGLPDGQKVILYPDKTWDYYKGISYDFDFSTLEDNKIPSFLRQGIDVDNQILKTAVEMYLDGWRYTMPMPKSTQASWDNYDGRTTWWKGYWYNTKTQKYSKKTPEKQMNGYYFGDEQNEKGYWRNGGSPSNPSEIDWLLSSSGGVKPN